jgi:hypothetical protein
MKKYINFNPVVTTSGSGYFGKIFPGKHFSEKSSSALERTKSAQNNRQNPMMDQMGAFPPNQNLLPQAPPLQFANQPLPQFRIEPPQLPLPAGWNGVEDFNKFLEPHVVQHLNRPAFDVINALNRELSQRISGLGNQLTPSALGEAFNSLLSANAELIAQSLPFGHLDSVSIQSPAGWPNMSIFRVSASMTQQQVMGVLNGYKALEKLANGGQLSPQEMASLGWAFRTVMMAPVRLGPYAVVMNVPAYFIFQLIQSGDPQYRGYALNVIRANIAVLNKAAEKQFGGPLS